ncbi:MAG: hypothetical protein NVS9B7_12290 [Flavisolibacter sp.]
MIKKILYSIVLLFVSFLSMAQDSSSNAQMAGVMRSNGKIYVVVAVILTIFFGIIIYLIRLDIKMTRLEKNPNT